MTPPHTTPRRFVPLLEQLEDRTLFAVSAIGAFEPLSATWFLRTTPGPGVPDAGLFQYGGQGSIPVVGDWDGDGEQDIGVVDPGSMTWQLHYGTGPGAADAGVFRYGGAGSVPVVGDWDGDGSTDIGVVDPGSMTWLLRPSASPGNPDAGVFQYGGPGSTPVVGDWDGDGRDGIGAVTADLVWLLRPTATPGNPDAGLFQYGGLGWKPVVGDWDGDDSDGIGAVDPSLTWYLHNQANAGGPDAGVFQYGGPGFIPLSGEFPPAAVDPGGGSFDVALRFSGLSPSQQAIVQMAAARWQQVIVGDLPNTVHRGTAVDDVLIDVRAQAIDGVGETLATSGPDSFRRGSRMPRHGTLRLDSADLASLEARGRLFAVVLHEMAHVFGFGTIWESRGLIVGAGTGNPQFLGPRATAEFNAAFGTNVASVPVEGLPSAPGSADGHWRESVFGIELMTPVFNGTVPLSRVTVASLADLGYVVNLGAADGFAPR